MNTAVLKWVFAGYMMMFIVLGMLSIAGSIGGPIPGPDKLAELENLVKDDKTRQFVLDSFSSMANRFNKLGEIATNSFQVVIGAIVGFLSAIASTVLGRTGKEAAQDAAQPETFHAQMDEKSTSS